MTSCLRSSRDSDKHVALSSPKIPAGVGTPAHAEFINHESDPEVFDWEPVPADTHQVTIVANHSMTRRPEKVKLVETDAYAVHHNKERSEFNGNFGESEHYQPDVSFTCFDDGQLFNWHELYMSSHEQESITMPEHAEQARSARHWWR